LSDHACSVVHAVPDAAGGSTAPAAPQLYTLSLHDALPISPGRPYHARAAAGAAHLSTAEPGRCASDGRRSAARTGWDHLGGAARSEEHTSELQSRENLVCRLLLEKRKTEDSDG